MQTSAGQLHASRCGPGSVVKGPKGETRRKSWGKLGCGGTGMDGDEVDLERKEWWWDISFQL